ncbi:SsgA family sporulation/cell division regulator [Streptomyces sp. NPDC046371]|uniref:SsgA family sporulation/cell division regulator n=1 Tax=Streptomyces sp. NPDC046371 TaxID=3154916 RepID=UPI0033D04D0E
MPQHPVTPLPAPRTLKRHLPMELLAPDAGVPVDTTVGYSSRDPHALSIAFHLLGARPIVWWLDREMVLTGSHTPTGTGEVHLSPTPDGDFLIRLGHPGDCATVRCDQDGLTRFVEETFALVPQGSEEQHIDWRPLLASLRR